MEIWTSRYHASDLVKHAISERGLIPVGITVGAARWLPYELAGNVGPLAPYNLRQLEGEEFDLAYVNRLEAFGAEAIERILAGLADAYSAKGVVLLCFEKVEERATKPCHRWTFAAWWEEKTGQKVPELEPAQLRLGK